MPENWNEAIIGTVKKKGGKEILLQDIYAGMENHPLVTPRLKEPWKTDKQLRYHTWINSYLSVLVRKGILVRVSRGVYSLNDKASSE